MEQELAYSFHLGSDKNWIGYNNLDKKDKDML